jgi:hypothetical protein
MVVAGYTDQCVAIAAQQHGWTGRTSLNAVDWREMVGILDKLNRDDLSRTISRISMPHKYIRDKFACRHGI